MWFLLCSHSMILISKLWKKEVRLDSRVCINSKENENIMSFHSNIIIFLGMKEQAHSLGVPGFELKIFRLQIYSVKGKNYMIQTQVQWNLERASLIGTCWEFNFEILRNAGHFGPVLICLGLFHPNLDGAWVFSDLVGGSFRPIFRVSHLGLWLFWPKSEIDNVCNIICVWMDRWASVKFCKNIRLKHKRALSRLRLKQPMSEPKRPVTITVWLREITRIYRENNSPT